MRAAGVVCVFVFTKSQYSRLNVTIIANRLPGHLSNFRSAWMGVVIHCYPLLDLIYDSDDQATLTKEMAIVSLHEWRRP